MTNVPGSRPRARSPRLRSLQRPRLRATVLQTGSSCGRPPSPANRGCPRVRHNGPRPPRPSHRAGARMHGRWRAWRRGRAGSTAPPWTRADRSDLLAPNREAWRGGSDPQGQCAWPSQSSQAHRPPLRRGSRRASRRADGPPSRCRIPRRWPGSFDPVRRCGSARRRAFRPRQEHGLAPCLRHGLLWPSR